MVTSDTLFELVPQIKNILIESGKVVISEWETLIPEKKGVEGDVVTNVDRNVEEYIAGELRKLGVTDQVHGEEAGGVIEGYTWVIDPIDGSKDYVGKMPSFTVQIALVRDGVSIAGFVYNPVSNQLFSAVKDRGAYLNDQKLFISNLIQISEAVIDLDFGGQQDVEWKTNIFHKIVQKAYRVRVSGGRFAPYLTTGGIHAFLILNPTTKIVDQAPRRVIFEEAGLIVEDLEIDGRKITLASYQSLINQIKETIT